MITVERVFKRRHTLLLASSPQHDGLELPVRFRGGIAEVRNAGAGDCNYAVTIPAVLAIEDLAFMHGGWRGTHVDRG